MTQFCECGLKKERFLVAKIEDKFLKELPEEKLEERWFCPKCNAGHILISEDGELKIIPSKLN